MWRRVLFLCLVMAVSALAQEGPPIVAPHGLERAAVDALARGDHALARRIYLELAGAPEAAPTFREAARILARNAAVDAR